MPSFEKLPGRCAARLDGKLMCPKCKAERDEIAPRRMRSWHKDWNSREPIWRSTKVKPVPNCPVCDTPGAPAYCECKVIVAEGRCKKHYKALVGHANGRATHLQRSKYTSAIPKRLRRHLQQVTIEDVASCRDEIQVLDARTSQLLASLKKDEDPQVEANRARKLIAVAVSSIDEGRPAVAVEAMIKVDSVLKSSALQAQTWEEIRRTLETRDKLARTEMNYQSLLSDRILIEHVNTFVQALIMEARMLSDDRKRLSAYVLKVLDHARAVLGPALVLKAENPIIDVEKE